ncbi:MAG: PKD domain-containing protein [Methylococcaceae bacterium]|nr:PKD domain-containing protein [Methylococcaceae bacterium]
MSSRITDSLHFVVGLIFISLTSFTNASSTHLVHDTISNFVHASSNSESGHFSIELQQVERNVKKPEDLDQNISKNKSSITKGEDEWWKKVQHNLVIAEYQPGTNGQGLQAPNRAHNLRTYFDSTGIRLHDRTAAGSPVLTALSLSKIGRGEKLENVPDGSVSRAGTRVEIRRPGIIEWYENSARGLEQGFTVTEKTSGQGVLVLELTVKQAKATLRGQSIELLTDAGRRLDYGKLFVEDAQGNKLSTHLEVSTPHLIRLVMNDSQAIYPLIIDPLITGMSDTILESNQADPAGFKPAVFGSNVASAGDVNGDGFDDIIVGAPGWDGGNPHEGAAFIFLGSALGIVGNSPSNAHARIESNQFGAQLGTLPATVVGDVNGDGYDDIVVGAHNYNDVLPGTTLAVDGAAFVFHGGPLGITGTDPTTANAHIHSNELGSDLGLYVSGAGDVNGDGFADIIVGVPNHGTLFPSGIPINDRSGNYGAALVFHGSLNGIRGTGFNDADAVILPYIDTGAPLPEPLGQIGSVSALGDINADGFYDIILGGNEIRLFLGSASGILASDITMAQQTILADPVLAISQSISGSGAGFLAEGVGDINGDNIPDAIASIPFRPLLPNFGPTSEGAVYVFLGTTTGLAASSGTVSSAHATFFGNQVAENLGLNIAGVGDVNGDTFNDIAFSARTFPGSLNAEGVAYILHGGLSGLNGTTLADADVRLESGQSGAATVANGTAVAVAGTGDINGDGFNDVIVGFPYYDAGQENEGAALIYHGEPSPITPNLPPIAIAGDDQALIDVDSSGAATVTLDGSLSVDPDGVIVRYQWREGETVLGTSPVLTTALSVNAIHKLVLIVTDDAGISRGDPVTVQVNSVNTTLTGFDDFSSGGFAGGIRWSGSWIISGNISLAAENLPFPAPTAPQALIGAGATMSRSTTLPVGTTGMKLKYHAKASQFSPADQVTVQVSRDGGPFTTITAFTAADSDDNYRYYDGTVGSLSWYPTTATNLSIRYVSTAATGQLFIDNIEVQAIQVPAGTPIPPAGVLPIAHAGNDIIVTDSDNNGLESVVLDGSLSTDTDGSIVSFEWFHETPLNGPQLLGTGANLLSSFDVGNHTIRLIVTDNSGASSTDTVLVTVNAGATTNLSPIANAGPDQTIIDVDGNTLEVVTFNGLASTDPDGTIVSYVWRKNGNPYNNVATFSITEPIGVHTIELTVTDDQGATSTDTVVVTIVANTAPPPSIVSLSAAPGSISGKFILSWTTNNASSASIDNGVGVVPVNGSVTVSPAVTTTYTLTATGDSGTTTSSVTINIQPPSQPPTIDSFAASPATISAGQSASLSWTTTGADSVSIDNGGGTGLLADSNTLVTPVATTSYTLTATGPGGTVTATQTVTVQESPIENLNITTFKYRTNKKEWKIAGNSSIPGPGNSMTIYVGPTVAGSPVLGTVSVDSLGNWSLKKKKTGIFPDSTGMISIQSSQGGTWEGISGVGPAPGSTLPPPSLPTVDSFSTSASIITVGDTAILSWTTSNADSISINGGVSLSANGNINVSPTTTTSYTIVATGAGGTASASVTITVNPAVPSAPAVDSFTATPATISTGGSSTLSWNTTGADSVSIDNGIGLVTANSSVIVTPSASTTYTLTATDTASGANTSSSVTVTVNNSAPAQATVAIVAPNSVNRGDSVSFSVTVTNTGSTTLSGVQLRLTLNPSGKIKDLSPGSNQMVADLLPGASATQVWSGQADKESSIAVTAETLIGGVSIATATHTLTIIK